MARSVFHINRCFSILIINYYKSLKYVSIYISTPYLMQHTDSPNNLCCYSRPPWKLVAGIVCPLCSSCTLSSLRRNPQTGKWRSLLWGRVSRILLSSGRSVPLFPRSHSGKHLLPSRMPIVGRHRDSQIAIAALQWHLNYLKLYQLLLS